VFNPFRPNPVKGTQTVTFLDGHGRPVGRAGRVVCSGFDSVGLS
jgi:hypothetical protein